MVDLDLGKMTAFEIVNWMEVFLWPILGLACVIGEKVKTGTTSLMIWVLGGAFMVFGFSDYLELRTGAWWRPLGLLLLKASCLAVFLGVGVRYRRLQKARGKTR